MNVQTGTECLACAGGSWHEVEISARNADGTYNAYPLDGLGDPDEWIGVTHAELSVDDEALWPEVFARMRGSQPALDMKAFGVALEGIGFDLGGTRLAELWVEIADSLSSVVDEAEAYDGIRELGLSAKDFTLGRRARTILYWDGVRMGGRDPSEVTSVGVLDMLALLNLITTDPALVAELEAFEAEQELVVPTSLRALITKQGVEQAVENAHPTGPSLLRPADWVVERIGSDHAIKFLEPASGEHSWWAVFSPGDTEAQVWIAAFRHCKPKQRIADSLSFFVLDVASTGRAVS
jgi:hypothetical protein